MDGFWAIHFKYCVVGPVDDEIDEKQYNMESLINYLQSFTETLHVDWFLYVIVNFLTLNRICLSVVMSSQKYFVTEVVCGVLSEYYEQQRGKI